MKGFRPLPWDTEFFGYRIAIVSEPSFTEKAFLEMLDAACDTGIECLYLLVSARDSDVVRLAEESGSHLTDIRITLTQRLDASRQSSQNRPASIRRAHEDEADILAKMAHDCFAETRFSRYLHFTEAQCEAFYGTWIEKSCRGWADMVLVAESEKGPAGFISCHSEAEGRGKIGLICVHRAARGQGLGKHLVDAALDWFVENGANRVSVVTQGSNISALQLFQKCGFAITSVDLWFHKWFE